MRLEKLIKTKAFDLRVKQHRVVLDFTTAIEDAMVAAGLNQQALAKRLNKSRAWVSKVFRSKPNLTFGTAVELADALGFDLEISIVPSTATVETYPEQAPQVFSSFFATEPASAWASATAENNVIQFPVQPSPQATPTFTPDPPRLERLG